MIKRPALHRFLSIITLLLVFTMLIPTIQSVPSIPKEIIIVDLSGNGDYTSIKEAIAHASATDIIQIQPGIYYENTITIGNKIDVVGTDTNTCIIDCNETQGFIILSTYVTLSHLTITNTKENAISILPGSNGCNISSVHISNVNDGNAIDIRSSYNTISHCTIDGPIHSGEAVRIQGNYNTIDDCAIQQFSIGIIMINYVTNNIIINCNILNNENAIDIRMHSTNNIVTNCNIYSNRQGFKIWQDSNDNNVYLNNIFKNDKNANDENNNQWDDGSQCNYWDVYQGIDENLDGIGDTPFIISNQSADHFPKMTMYLPDVIIAPTDIIQTTSTADPTPTFTWSPAIYNKGITGYTLRIDTGQEIIIETTTWTAPTNLTNGVHTLTLHAIGTDGQRSASASLKFTIDTNFNDLDHDGWSDEEELRYGSDPNNPENYPLDTDSDHVTDSIDTDDDNDGYSDEMEASYSTDSKERTSYPKDTDGDTVPDDGSPDGKYQADIDRDDDGLLNTIELQLGSNPENTTDVHKLYLGGTPAFLVDTSSDGIYDLLYDPASETTHAVEYTADGTYLIDANGDGLWDYLYNPTNDVVTPAPGITVPMILLYAVIILVLIALLIISILYYQKIKSLRPKKLKKQVEKPLPVISPIDKETQEMVSDTRTLLYHIQHDVNTYIEKLNQIEKQIPAVSIKMEREQPPVKEIPIQNVKEPETPPSTKQPIQCYKSTYDDIDAEVDKILEAIRKKQT
jgi:hypothetical protein